jgi:hypothetical protein
MNRNRYELASAVALALVAQFGHATTLSILAVACLRWHRGYYRSMQSAVPLTGGAGSYSTGGALRGMWVLAQGDGLSMLTLRLPIAAFVLDAVMRLGGSAQTGRRVPYKLAATDRAASARLVRV